MASAAPPGRERISATTIVRLDGAPVHATGSGRASHWCGYLPPGDHVVVVIDGAERFECIVTVGRRSLRLRL